MSGEYYARTIKCSRSDVLDTFLELVRQCQYDYGHAGYSGTFAEKQGGVKIIPVPAGQEFWTEDGAEMHCNEENDKWGPAFAYEIAPDTWYIGGVCSS